MSLASTCALGSRSRALSCSRSRAFSCSRAFSFSCSCSCSCSQSDDDRSRHKRIVRDCASAFKSLLEERQYWVEDAWIEGEIPKDLSGTYFRNGPGLQRPERHCFDGDGMVFSVSFKDGRAFFRNRFVRTAGFVAEQAAGYPFLRTTFTEPARLHPRPRPRPRMQTQTQHRFSLPFAFSLPTNPFDLARFKNVANTGVVHWGGRLFALWEAGKPHELDPRTLATLGKSNFFGEVLASRNGGVTLGGHYRVHETTEGGGRRRRLVTFGVHVDVLAGSSVRFFEFDEGGALASTSAQVPLGGVTFVHDLAITENYYVLALGPIDFDWARFLRDYVLLGGRCSIAQCLRFDKGGEVKVVLVPRRRRDGAPPIVAMAPISAFPFHHVNAYEEGSSVVLDTIGWNDVDFDRDITSPSYYTGRGGCLPHLVRIRVDTVKREVTEARRLACSRPVEFPCVDPRVVGRRHAHVYCLAGPEPCGDVSGVLGPSQALLRIGLGSDDVVDTEVWEPGSRRFCGEPMVVKKHSSSDVWIIMGVHDAETLTADLHVFDGAKGIACGPVATLHLPHHLPASFHGSFSDGISFFPSTH